VEQEGELVVYSYSVSGRRVQGVEREHVHVQE
jgi:hypothetical protein